MSVLQVLPSTSIVSSVRLVPLVARASRRSFFTIVNQGHESWRLALGTSPTKLEPGIRLAIPFYHTVQNIDMRETSVTVDDLTGFTSDNVPVLISGSLFYRVRNSYDACFAVHDFRENVKNIGTSAIRSVVGHFTYDDVIGDRNRTNVKLHETIGSSIDKWGVECTRFEIQNFKPLNRDVEKQLELQMAAERERRKQLLDTQAMVNVAEGQKTRAILESEGALQAQLNQAAGQKEMSILESEGARQASLNEGRALAEQVELIARSLSVGDENPSPELRIKALEALVELRRLEQLKAIAKGHGTSTYFFDGAKGLLREPYDVDNAEKWKRTLTDRVRVDASVDKA
ncbi:hypothetical protein JAAARDRAFT_29538 [Jaapia argillacea MUCL 33604]|uniref:Band 7 domain-containing protein n=1 Tax=Jaapia argillacea MUCL 33604 TaxID=933084 RepID=A0A067QLL6_9AGAM|nr:hypothetical protein JAAARDRAFT_29538 [Jaapia argillacea MUCL 33604]